MRALAFALVVAASLAGCKHAKDAPTCLDKVLNGAESDVDCGGGTCPNCGTGRHCREGGDCQSKLCLDGACVRASCTDKLRNGSESDVDCGGPDCRSCADGRMCYGNNDCLSLVCSGTVCLAPSCNDGYANGDEEGIDCGGAQCPPCEG
jgi:hypothetical protein